MHYIDYPKFQPDFYYTKIISINEYYYKKWKKSKRSNFNYAYQANEKVAIHN